MEMLDYLIFARRSLHKIPELYHQEFLTQKFITEQLDSFNIKYKTIKTGVIADIEGCDKKTRLAFRADMDALPIKEQNQVDYKSTHEGVMHACGHDGHTAMLLGLAKYLSQNKPAVNVRLIFQPAEESEGGAEMLIENGALKDVDAIFGLHLSPEYPLGVIATDAGAIFAGVCDFHIIFEGISGHCADKQKYIDALWAGNEFYNRIHELYNSKYKDKTLFHIGKITGGNASNVVADYAKYDCTFRFFDEAIEEDFMMRLEEILIDIQKLTGASHRLIVENYYPPLVNSAHIVQMIKKKFNITPAQPKYTAEDFAYYLKKVSGAFAWLGIKDENHSAPLHSPNFDFDEKALLSGVDYYIKIAQNYLLQD
ncbi:MAG TPA: M20 family metallopeptidase [Clostridia bacterium]